MRSSLVNHCWTFYSRELRESWVKINFLGPKTDGLLHTRKASHSRSITLSQEIVFLHYIVHIYMSCYDILCPMITIQRLIAGPIQLHLRYFSGSTKLNRSCIKVPLILLNLSLCIFYLSHSVLQICDTVVTTSNGAHKWNVTAFVK
jgi:hypothetical protein